MNEAKIILMNPLSSEEYLSVNKALISRLGLVESVVLSLLIESDKYFKDRQDDWFFIKSSRIQDALQIKRWTFDTTIKTLKDKQLIETETKGCPPITHYRINYYNVLCLIKHQ